VGAKESADAKAEGSQDEREMSGVDAFFLLAPTYKKEIYLNADRKRFWTERIASAHSELCIASMPLDVKNLDGRLYARGSNILFCS
jgi:hypothetical protein